MERMLFFFSHLFFADADSHTILAVAEEGKSYNYWQEFVNMLITLGVILGLIFVTVWLLKRFMASRGRQLNRSSSIQILERRQLNQKSALYLVKIHQKKVVISESPAGIQLICECGEEEESRDEVEDEELSPSFSTLLKDKIKNRFLRNA
jgi:flagellar biosynthetic protein FliO